MWLENKTSLAAGRLDQAFHLSDYFLPVFTVLAPLLSAGAFSGIIISNFIGNFGNMYQVSTVDTEAFYKKIPEFPFFFRAFFLSF